MTEKKKVLICLPTELLAQADAMANEEQKSRSEFIRCAMKLYIRQKHKMEIREKLRRGYEQMAHINTEWAELGLSADEEALEAYEALLAESENLND